MVRKHLQFDLHKEYPLSRGWVSENFRIVSKMDYSGRYPWLHFLGGTEDRVEYVKKIGYP